MKLLLFKLSADPHVAHIYEHLFVRSLRLALQDKKLFNYLDYDVSGYAYKSYIELELIAFTSRAEKHLTTFIAQPKLLLTEKAINNAVCEITAEQGHRLFGNIDKLRRTLQKLDKQPWINSNDLEFYSTKTTVKHTILQSTQRVALATLSNRVTIKTSYLPKPEHRLLFHIVATTILSNLLVVLNHDYHYYFKSGKTHYKGDTIYAEYTYQVWRSYRPKFSTEQMASTKAYTAMINNGLADAIVYYLGYADFSKTHSAPDNEETTSATGILTGAKGWHMLARKDLIVHLLNNLTIELRRANKVVHVQKLD